MFNITNLLQKISKPAPVKAMVSNSFVSNLETLSNLKEKTKEKDDKRIEESNNYFTQAKIILDSCIKSNNFPHEKLREASEYILKSLEFYRNNAEAYLNLAYIFYILGETQLSIKYLRIASEINPNLEGLQKLRDVISNENITPTTNTIIATTNSTIKPVTKVSINTEPKKSIRPAGGPIRSTIMPKSPYR